jgi:adenylate cyclase
VSAALLAYLPADRRVCLARGQTLPDRARGAALFADISGFTSLTEQWTQSLGARRGIEVLTRRINAVYEALIASVEQHGGSVVSFAGDAITCWFGEHTPFERTDERSSLYAVAAALAMQTAMRSFPDISLKVAVATGQARRLVVGDPQIQLLDTLAGETIARLGAAEHMARQGEVVMDAATVEACGNALKVGEWRTGSDTNERFATLVSSLWQVANVPGIAPPDTVPPETLRVWVPPTVYAREQSGLGEFLTELRPAVALFLRFAGIDYDGDEHAGEKLDAVIRRVQQVVRLAEGALLQLTIGDKGSYLYACFGAPVAHEDDARRAVKAALALCELPHDLTFLQPVQIGLSRGTLRLGAYGSATRRTYGALGYEVNLAARLMSLAAPGEILVTARIQELLDESFALEPRLPVTVKGKSGALNVFALRETSQRRATRLHEPAYRLPIVGRQAELELIAKTLELARGGQGQIIGLTAEAGLGKSRLVAEAVRLAQRQGFAGYGGACESSGTNTAYLVWKAIWQAFFDVDPTSPARRQVRHLESELEDRAPHRLQAMPLLASILDLPIDDNDFTRMLEPKDRRNALAALLEDCLKAAAKEEPVLFVLEDVHWIDPLSHDLLDSLARATANTAVCVLLAYRPHDLERLQAPRVEALPHFSRIGLTALPPADAEHLIQAKLAQLFPERGGELPKALVEQLTGKAQGNPFFLEELLNYLRDRGLSPYDEQALTSLELPSSLHTLILSRLDQLTETQKATLKVASIIGRLFPFAWLQGYYPALGAPEAIQADLNETARLDITPLDRPAPELAYLFKHIVTQEVTYESLAYATRAQLHELLAQYLEGQAVAGSLDRLAFHYGRSENQAKQREYFRKAGDAAQAAFANEAALEYYARLLPLLSEPSEQADLHLKRGAVLELLGRWEEAERHYGDALAQAGQDATRAARCKQALGKLCRLRGDYPAALEWLEQARQGWAVLQDQAGLVPALIEIGGVLWQQGDYVAARRHLEEGLALARGIGDRRSMAYSLHYSGAVASSQGDYPTAWALYEESLALRREMGDKQGIGVSLNNLGLVASSQGDYLRARKLNEESLALRREMGDKPGIATSLYNLGNVASYQGDYPMARKLYEESLALFREMGDKQGIAYSLAGLGYGASLQGDYAAARALLDESLALSREMGDKQGIAWSLNNLGFIAAAQGDFAPAQALLDESLALRREMGDKYGIGMSLHDLGYVALSQTNYPTARRLYEESLVLRREIGDKPGTMYCLVGLAGVAAAGPEEGARAAQLAGRAEALRAGMGSTMEPVQRGVYERAVATVKAALGEAAFNAAFDAGQKMTLDEAVQFALGEN